VTRCASVCLCAGQVYVRECSQVWSRDRWLPLQSWLDRWRLQSDVSSRLLGHRVSPGNTWRPIPQCTCLNNLYVFDLSSSVMFCPKTWSIYHLIVTTVNNNTWILYVYIVEQGDPGAQVLVARWSDGCVTSGWLNWQKGGISGGIC